MASSANVIETFGLTKSYGQIEQLRSFSRCKLDTPQPHQLANAGQMPQHSQLTRGEPSFGLPMLRLDGLKARIGPHAIRRGASVAGLIKMAATDVHDPQVLLLLHIYETEAGGQSIGGIVSCSCPT